MTESVCNSSYLLCSKAYYCCSISPCHSLAHCWGEEFGSHWDTYMKQQCQSAEWYAMTSSLLSSIFVVDSPSSVAPRPFLLPWLLLVDYLLLLLLLLLEIDNCLACLLVRTETTTASVLHSSSSHWYTNSFFLLPIPLSLSTSFPTHSFRLHEYHLLLDIFYGHLEQSFFKNVNLIYTQL